MGAKGFDYDRIQRIVVIVGMAVVFGLWLAEEAGLIRTAAPRASTAIPPSALPGLQSSADGLVVQGVIAGNRRVPGIGVLAPARRARGAGCTGAHRSGRPFPDNAGRGLYGCPR